MRLRIPFGKKDIVIKFELYKETKLDRVISEIKDCGWQEVDATPQDPNPPMNTCHINIELAPEDIEYFIQQEEQQRQDIEEYYKKLQLD